jgi:hypothetical protein
MMSGKISAVTTRWRSLKPRYADLRELELLIIEY